jgi:hypothetical protein
MLGSEKFFFSHLCHKALIVFWVYKSREETGEPKDGIYSGSIVLFKEGLKMGDPF